MARELVTTNYKMIGTEISRGKICGTSFKRTETEPNSTVVIISTHVGNIGALKNTCDSTSLLSF